MLDIGESLVGSFFKYVLGCKIVVYNAHFEGRQGEIDVLAFSEQMKKVYMCEVVTHIRGTLYGDSYGATIKRLQDKINRAVQFAAEEFPNQEVEMHVWTPVAPSGLENMLLRELKCPSNKIPLVIITNQEYSKRIDSVIDEAKKRTHATDEPAFRLLQILAHLRR